MPDSSKSIDLPTPSDIGIKISRTHDRLHKLRFTPPTGWPKGGESRAFLRNFKDDMKYLEWAAGLRNIDISPFIALQFALDKLSRKHEPKDRQCMIGYKVCDGCAGCRNVLANFNKGVDEATILGLMTSLRKLGIETGKEIRGKQQKERLSNPMPLTEIANRMNNMTPESAKKYLKDIGALAQISRQMWQVRLDLVSPDIETRLTKTA